VFTALRVFCLLALRLFCDGKRHPDLSNAGNCGALCAVCQPEARVHLTPPFPFVWSDDFMSDFTVQVNRAFARPGVRIHIARTNLLDSCVEFIRFW